MRKIFLDCGGNIGQSIKAFKSSSFYDDSFEIYSFEPTPILYEHLKGFEGPNVHIVGKAVWVIDGTIDFYVNSENVLSQGNTVMKDKTSGRLDKNNPVVVECIDFNSWIRNNFDVDDEIILKMDIEGCEYEVLPWLYLGGALKYINTLYVEFHEHKMPGYKVKHENLINLLDEFGKENRFEYRVITRISDWLGNKQ